MTFSCHIVLTLAAGCWFCFPVDHWAMQVVVQISPRDRGGKQQPSRQAEHSTLPPTAAGIHLLFYLPWCRPHLGCHEEWIFTKSFY